jgi:tetratricopeptide (TPR) repeat protein
MKLRSLWTAVAGLVLFAASALAQVTTMEGTVTGTDGKPAQGAIVKIHRTDIKWDAQVKTDKRGHYIHTGVPLGTFEVSVIINGEEANKVSGVRSQMGDHPPLDFDLRKSASAPDTKAMMQQAMTTGEISDDLSRQLSPEQLAALKKQMEENKGKIQKNNALNASFNEGMTALKAAPTQATPDARAQAYQTAITALEKAGQLDPTQPAVWSNLGDAYLGLASTKTGPDFDAATAKGIEAYDKSIALKPTDPATHNNYALALAKAKKYPEAEAELRKAAEIDPATAYQRFYNLGALLSNIGQSEPAAKAFKAAIDSAPDNPKNAESYYQYALSLAAQATTGKDGKFVFPDGTIEAFQKYIQMAPTGPNAQACKDMITQLGGSVQTDFKNPNAPTTKKKN